MAIPGIVDIGASTKEGRPAGAGRGGASVDADGGADGFAALEAEAGSLDLKKSRQ